MDMKKILQAFDSASTKSVEGASSMSKFLRIVKEAEEIPAMPDVTGLQPGQSKNLEGGERLTVNKDGTVSYSGGWGTYVYNAQGQHIKTQSPSVAGYSQETDPTGKVTQQNYNAGPMSIQKDAQGTTANYQLGAQNLTTTLKESSNPHKVALPVQMAMQHYQQKTKKAPSLLEKYFKEAEEEILKEKEERRVLINQYASVIAERVRLKNKKD